MKLLKVIIFFFIIYLIRRFFQMYQVVRRMQQAPISPEVKNTNTVEADYKVLD